MEFFQTFWNHLDAELQTYISIYVTRVADALTPVILLGGALYVMSWGYLHVMGRLEEPVTAGLKRIFTLGIILALSLQFWTYHDLIVDTFYSAPMQLAQAIVAPGAGQPAFDAVTVVDDVWKQGATAAGHLWSRGSVLPSGWGFGIAAAFVCLIVGILCIYTFFLLALSKVALSILLALGPLFLLMLLFETTSQYFMAWIGQLANYALVTILVTMVCALFLNTVDTYAVQTAQLGSAILTTDVLDLLLICGLALLFMMQVPHIAAALALGGVPLNTQSVGARVYGRFERKARAYAQRARERIKSWRSSRGRRPRARTDWNAPAGQAPGARTVSRNSIEPVR